MTSVSDKVRAKAEKHRKLNNSTRVRSVLAFLISKGLLISNESFGKAPGSLKLGDFLYTAEHYEPSPHYSSDFYCEWRLPNITGALCLFSTSMCLGTLSPEKRHKAPVISDTHHSRNEV
jgi:hypothetical protein